MITQRLLARQFFLAVVTYALSGCAVAASLSSPPSTSTAETAAPAQAETAAPVASDVPIDDPIVGTWERRQTCDELRVAFERARLLASHLDWFEELCAETQVPTKHSHLFTADGGFVSLDQDGQQVDEGTYVVDGGELRFPRHAADFGYDGEILVEYLIDGDIVTFDVRVPDVCDEPCGLAHFWAVSAFGTNPWTRAE